MKCPLCNEQYGNCKHDFKHYIKEIERLKKVIERALEYIKEERELEIDEANILAYNKMEEILEGS